MHMRKMKTRRLERKFKLFGKGVKMKSFKEFITEAGLKKNEFKTFAKIVKSIIKKLKFKKVELLAISQKGMSIGFDNKEDAKKLFDAVVADKILDQVIGRSSIKKTLDGTFWLKLSVLKSGIIKEETVLGATELLLYIDNTSKLYKVIIRQIIPKLKKLLKNGKIDRKKGAALFTKIVSTGAKGYEKEVLAGGDKKIKFDSKTQKSVAVDLSNFYSDEIESGNY